MYTSFFCACNALTIWRTYTATKTNVEPGPPGYRINLVAGYGGLTITAAARAEGHAIYTTLFCACHALMIWRTYTAAKTNVEPLAFTRDSFVWGWCTDLFDSWHSTPPLLHPSPLYVATHIAQPMIPPRPSCFAIQDTILVMAISCEGQQPPRVPGEPNIIRGVGHYKIVFHL